MKSAYVIPVSSDAVMLTQRLVPDFCLCHTYASVPGVPVVLVATANVPAPEDEAELPGCDVIVTADATSAAMVSSAIYPSRRCQSRVTARAIPRTF